MTEGDGVSFDRQEARPLGRLSHSSHWRTNDAAHLAPATRLRGAGYRAVGGLRAARGRARAAPSAVLLLPLLLLPPQLLAAEQPAVAGAEGPPVRAPARVSGLPRVQGAGLAVRTLDTDEVLPRPPLLARPILK